MNFDSNDKNKNNLYANEKQKILSGGKIYGKGAKGAAYDAACILDDKETFCYEISKKIDGKKIENIIIKLFSSTTGITKVFKSEDIFNKFLNDLKGNDEIILKKFINEKTKERDFNNEIAAIQDLFFIYRMDVEKYTALTEINLLDDFKYIGFSAQIGSERNFYVVNKKCGDTFDKISSLLLLNQYHTRFSEELNLMISNILDSLLILYNNKMYHCDIKPNNIICDETEGAKVKYKLIDWEKAKKLKDLKDMYNSKSLSNPYGGVAYTSPLCVLLHKQTTNVHEARFELFKLAVCKEIAIWPWDNDYKRYSTILEERVCKPCKSLFQESSFDMLSTYISSFDLFALGISILICVIRNKNYTDAYLPFIDTLINYTNINYSYNPKIAIRNWERLNKSIVIKPDGSGGAHKNSKIDNNYLYLRSNMNKLFKVQNEGTRKFIILKKSKMYLSDIRGQYRFLRS